MNRIIHKPHLQGKWKRPQWRKPTAKRLKRWFVPDILLNGNALNRSCKVSSRMTVDVFSAIRIEKSPVRLWTVLPAKNASYYIIQGLKILHQRDECPRWRYLYRKRLPQNWTAPVCSTKYCATLRKLQTLSAKMCNKKGTQSSESVYQFFATSNMLLFQFQQTVTMILSTSKDPARPVGTAHLWLAL